MLAAGSGVTLTGSGSLTDPYVIASNSGGVTVVDGSFLDLTLSGVGTAQDPYVLSGVTKEPIVSQARTGNGAVTVNAALGDARVRLAGNATSTVLTGGSEDRPFTLQYVQDGTGGRTYVWPTNCKFAGASAPSDTTLNSRTSVTFRYDSVTALFYEVSRAVSAR